MDRRGLLKALLGATAAPLIGPKAAAKALGVSLATNATPIADVVQGPGNIMSGGGMSAPRWWGSPMQITLEARRAARHEANTRYAHFKSWGPAFRESVIVREEVAMLLIERQCQQDDGFFDKVVTLLGVGDGVSK